MLLVRRAMVKPDAKVPPAKNAELPEAIAKLALRRRPMLAGSAADNHGRLAKAKQEIEKQLKLISNYYQQIDEVQAATETCFKVVEAQLRLVNLKEHSDGIYKAALEEIWSRQQRTIDPKKFKARVANDVFWDSIKVSLDAAAKHLSEKELNAIADVVPAKATGVQLKISKVKYRK